MVLTDDEFRPYIEKMNGGGLRCKFCRQTFAAATSITRFKWHWSGVEGNGVKICAQVTTDIQQKALQATQQASNKKRKTMPSSSNMHEVVREQINEVVNFEGAPSRTNVTGNHMESMTGGMIQLSSSSPRRLIFDAQYETRGDAQQATDTVGQVDLEETKWNVLANIAQRMEVDAENEDGIDGDTIPTKKLVGGEFEKNKNAIWSWLMDVEDSSSLGIYGIYGMGGVGKTTLIIHIYNLLIRSPKSFRRVLWVTVSQDFSISKLQNHIAKGFGLDLLSVDNELMRAAKLSKELKKKQQQWFLILDDIWEYIDFDKIGIPMLVNRCKVILTSRSFEIYRQMGCCQRMIQVQPLSTEEAWILFKENLGRDTALPPKMEQIAEHITKECAGLPLGIKTMARTMRGVIDIQEWRNVLLELQESKVRQDDMEPEVFKILRFSYTHLKDSAVQQCLLYCSLFPEDFIIDRHDLIAYLIDEGVIEERNSRQAQFDKAHAMLNKLLNVGLLERFRKSCGDYVRVHDLIRDMALQIMQANSPVMVKAGAGLTELPDVEVWTDNLVRVFLMANQIKKLPDDPTSIHSPRCPSLSTLLLSYNEELQFIADSFFSQLQGLKVLDLSYTMIEELPDSVSDLESLTALFLIRCWRLWHVPSLKKLRVLKRLDLSETALENLPQGMECLTNLEYLRLDGRGLKEFPNEILSKFFNLQVLIIEQHGGLALVTVNVEEVVCLRKLEDLECRFKGHSDFLKYLISLERIQAPNRYKIYRIDEKRAYIELMRPCRRNRVVVLSNLGIKRDVVFEHNLPNNIEELVIFHCFDARSLFDISPSIKRDTAELERISIYCCNRMESLLSSSFSATLPLPFYGIFSGLKEFNCYECASMKKLFPLVLLPNLINLEVIYVSRCWIMEEIIGTRDQESSSNSSSYSISEFMNLPKLRILKLGDLPKLKSICCANLLCDSLEELHVVICPGLKKIPICLPLLENGQPSPHPSL